MTWLNDHSWIMFAFCALSLFVAAATLLLHLRLTPIAPRHLAVLSVGALFAGVGAALAGMQTGADPIVSPATALPLVRVLWLIAGACLLGESVAYLSFVGSGLGKSGRRGIEGGNVAAQTAQLLDDAALLHQDFIDSQPPHDEVVADEQQEQEADETGADEKSGVDGVIGGQFRG
jgi:hypothetical protein